MITEAIIKKGTETGDRTTKLPSGRQDALQAFIRKYLLFSRRLNSIQTRNWCILILYNAVKILEMKYEGKMEKLQDKK